jgi:hypothetical protein
VTAANHASPFAQGKPDNLNPEDNFILELIERTGAWGTRQKKEGYAAEAITQKTELAIAWFALYERLKFGNRRERFKRRLRSQRLRFQIRRLLAIMDR